MPNNLQAMIYKFSAVTPVAFIFALVWLKEKGTWLIPVISAGVGGILIILFAVSFKYAKAHVAPIAINVTEITPADKWFFAYVISYMIPFASIAISSFNPWITLAVSLLLVLALAMMNSPFPNPLLYVRGYHFFAVSAENGVKEYVLISKQRLRNTNQIKTVKRLFEYLLYDERR